MANQLANKVAFVAGGTGIVGSGIVRSLVEHGTKVWVTSRNQASLDALEKSVPESQKANLRLRKLVSSDEKELIDLKNTIIKKDTKIDHVVSSLGSFWGKGLLGDQSLDEFKKVLDDCATSHFIVYKTFAKTLSQQPKSTYTFITGTLGESCALPTSSLITVAASALFGIHLAAAAEYAKSPNLKISEVRYGSFIKNRPDKEYDPIKSQLEVGNDWTAKFVTKIIQNHKGGLFKVYNRTQGEEVYKTI